MKNWVRTMVFCVCIFYVLTMSTIKVDAYEYDDTDIDIELNDEVRQNYVEKMIRLALIYNEDVINELNNGHKAVFMFDGASNNMSDAELADLSVKRVSGLVVIIELNDEGKPTVVYTNHDCTSLPDFPLRIEANRKVKAEVKKQGRTEEQVMSIDVGPATLNDGTYKLYPTNHLGQYMALNARYAASDWYVDSVYMSPEYGVTYGPASGINLHARESKEISTKPYAYVWSAGCQLIGTNMSEYENFLEVIYEGLPRASAEKKTGTSVGVYVLNRYLLCDQIADLYDSALAADALTKYSVQSFQDAVDAYLRRCGNGKCYYESRQMVATKDCRIWNVPCSDETNFIAEAVGSVKKGDVLKITGEVVNTADHLWYNMELNGQECYIYGEYVEEERESGWLPKFDW